MHLLSNMPQESIHVQLLMVDIVAAQENPSDGRPGLRPPLAWLLRQAIQPSRHGLAHLFLWHHWTELSGLLANSDGQLCKVLGWSVGVPQNSFLQRSQALHKLYMFPAPQSIEGFAVSLYKLQLLMQFCMDPMLCQ